MGKLPALSFEEAQARLIALAPEIPVEHRDVTDCLGYFLAEPVAAQRDAPAAPMSAMDGYALNAADLGADHSGPWRVVGESAAGHPFTGRFGAGEAVRISTGAILPQGADCVLLQEDTARSADLLTLTGEPPRPPGRHIRAQAMDFAAGGALLAAGTRIGPAQIALAIAGGHHLLPVRRRLRIAVIDSGDELVAAGGAHGSHKLPASNGPMLAAMAAALPCAVTRIGPVPDSTAALVAALEEARDADVIVTSGGASVGDHDLIRPALAEIGAQLEFWRVSIKPGKPLLVARRGSQVVLGLPGNPASAFVTAWLFMLPLLRAALGAAQPLPQPFAVPLGEPLAPGGSRTEFIRAQWNGASVTPDALQDSGAISPLARANALILREADAPERSAGTPVSVYLL